MSEPCRHERDTLDELTAVAVHGALGAAQLEVEALRAEVEHERQRREDVVDEHQKAGRSWDTSRARLTTERDEARAEIERIRALLGDFDGPLWPVRGVREADIRAALGPAS